MNKIKLKNHITIDSRLNDKNFSPIKFLSDFPHPVNFVFFFPIFCWCFTENFIISFSISIFDPLWHYLNLVNLVILFYCTCFKAFFNSSMSMTQFAYHRITGIFQNKLLIWRSHAILPTFFQLDAVAFALQTILNDEFCALLLPYEPEERTCMCVCVGFAKESETCQTLWLLHIRLQCIVMFTLYYISSTYSLLLSNVQQTVVLENPLASNGEWSNTQWNERLSRDLVPQLVLNYFWVFAPLFIKIWAHYECKFIAAFSLNSRGAFVNWLFLADVKTRQGFTYRLSVLRTTIRETFTAHAKCILIAK